MSRKKGLSRIIREWADLSKQDYADMTGLKLAVIELLECWEFSGPATERTKWMYRHQLPSPPFAILRVQRELGIPGEDMRNLRDTWLCQLTQNQRDRLRDPMDVEG